MRKPRSIPISPPLGARAIAPSRASKTVIVLPLNAFRRIDGGSPHPSVVIPPPTARFPPRGLPLLLDVRRFGANALDDNLGQRDVAERVGHLLAVGHRPLDHLP